MTCLDHEQLVSLPVNIIIVNKFMYLMEDFLKLSFLLNTERYQLSWLYLL